MSSKKMIRKRKPASATAKSVHKVPGFTSEEFANAVCDEIDAGWWGPVTDTHRVVLAFQLLLTAGIQPHVQMVPRPERLRINKLVWVDCPHAKRACSYPEDGTLVGLLTDITGNKAMVKITSHCYVAVDVEAVHEIP